jgi:aryl-alcohol dehydrogenase-like predicted oxidoreductase
MTTEGPWLDPRPAGAPASLALGTMNLGKRTDPRESARMIARALERGVALFDTANVYNDGESERIVGKALRADRERVLIATKVGLMRQGSGAEGLSRARVLAACDESLARLGCGHIDVYYLHAPDPRTPMAETLEAIAELMRAGKIRHLGVSNHASWQLLDLSAGCAALGIAPPRLSQVLYNLLIRQIEIEYLAYARAHPVHTTVYNALAGGLLTGRHQREARPLPGSRFDGNRMYQRRYLSSRFFDLVDAYQDVAAEASMSLVDLSYAWLASRPGVDSILIGPASTEQLDAALDAAALAVPPEALARIDEIHRDFTGTDATYAR